MSDTTNPTPAPSPTMVLAGKADLDADALALLTDDLSEPDYFDRLVDAGQSFDAVRLLAHALPPRAAVWWAWGCAKQSAGEEPTGDTAKSLEATRVWLAEPTDERRRAAARIGNEVDDPDAAAMAAMAVLFAEGSVGPPDQPHQQAPPGVAARLAGGAVTMAAVVEPDGHEERLALYLKQGREVARKSGVWAEADEGSEAEGSP